jgi:hypothetical protein
MTPAQETKTELRLAEGDNVDRKGVTVVLFTPKLIDLVFIGGRDLMQVTYEWKLGWTRWKGKSRESMKDALQNEQDSTQTSGDNYRLQEWCHDGAVDVVFRLGRFL